MRQLNGLQAERKYCGNRQDSLITDAAIREIAQSPSSEPYINPRISCHCVSKVALGKAARAFPSIRFLESDSRVQQTDEAAEPIRRFLRSMQTQCATNDVYYE